MAAPFSRKPCLPGRVESGFTKGGETGLHGDPGGPCSWPHFVVVNLIVDVLYAVINPRISVK